MVLLKQMIEQSEAGEERKQLERRKLDQLLGYCESMQCRRQVLLAGFGETYPAACGNCDNCLQPAASWDATLAAQKALSCVYRTGQRFGAVHLIDVLRGSESERIQQFGHDKLSTYGIGKDLDAKSWRSVFRQLVATGLLEVDSEAYGGLRLTDSSRAVLTGKQSVVLRKEAESKKTRERDRGPRTGVSVQPQDLSLFGALRDLRAQLAREQNVPAYVIFHDSTLRNIAELRPESLVELAKVGGIGGAKLERYGPQVLETIRAQG
jgi:ATP-dependent DNA helicase RecQ